MEGSNRYMGRQQGCSDAQEWIVDKKNSSRDNNVKEKQDNGKFRSIGRNNMKKHEAEHKLKKRDGLA